MGYIISPIKTCDWAGQQGALWWGTAEGRQKKLSLLPETMMREKGNTPVVLHQVQVSLQGWQEELQDLWVSQQLRGRSSNHSQPFKKVLIR